MSVTTVYLARHGRTAFNAEDRMRGLSDPPLDDIGIAEAQKLAAALADKRPAAIISSPLQRAVATAQSIADAAGVPATVDIRLNDRDYGPHTGAKRAEVIARYGSIDNAPGVEPVEAVRQRALSAFTALIDEHDGGPLILVSHDAFNRALLGQLDTTLTDAPQRTACWNRLERVDGIWRVEEYDQKPD